MAQNTIIKLIDDIDGKDADETVVFTFDGVEYQIDLSEKNADKLRTAIEPFVNAAQRIGGRKTRGAGKVTAINGGGRTKLNRDAIRRFADSQGYPSLSDRGRIPQAIMDAYEEAGSPQ